MTDTLAPTLIWVVIAGMALTNFSLRFLPMAALSRLSLPDPLMRWLSYIPISVMGALFAKEIVLPALEVAPTVPLYANPGIYGGIGAMIAFRITKSFVLSSLMGVGVYLVVRVLFEL